MSSLLKDLEESWAKNAKGPFTSFISTGLEHLKKACTIVDRLKEEHGEECLDTIKEIGEKDLLAARFEAEMALLFVSAEKSDEAKYIRRIAKEIADKASKIIKK